MEDPGIAGPAMIQAWVLRILKEAVFAVLVGWLGNYTYKHLVEPLDTPPVLSGAPVSIQTDVGGRLAPPRQALQPVESPPPVPIPTSPELPLGPVVFKDGTRADVYPHVCKMPDGRSLDFRAVVFSDSYSWLIESDDQVQINDQTFGEEEFVSRLRSPGLHEILARAGELIAVGTASCEGKTQGGEDGRALRRARKLGSWLELARPWPEGNVRPARSLHLLNLGRYSPGGTAGQACNPPAPATTWNQRKVLLLAVAERASGTDLEECIRQTLRSDDLLRPLIENYSRFDLDKTTGREPI
jgi:hypothetical protein